MEIVLILVVIAGIIYFIKKKPEPPLPDFCTVDSDCPTGYYCENGKCVKIPEEEEPYPPIPEPEPEPYPPIPEPPPAVGVQFIMLGSRNRTRVWHLSESVYKMKGTLKNVGDKTGTTTVIGWFRVGNYGSKHDVYQEAITLGPSQTRDILLTITRAKMETAEREAGYSRGDFEFLFACISTKDHATYGTAYGWLAASDVVSIE